MRCTVANCSNSTAPNMRLFRIPAANDRRKAWIHNMGLSNPPGPSARCCQAHFEESMFEAAREDGNKKLKNTAVPTIFNEGESGVAANEKKARQNLIQRFNTSTLFSCCFPGCRNAGYDKVLTAYCKGKRMLVERYRMYKVHVTNKSHTFYRHHRRHWLPRIGLKLKDIRNKEQAPYLCDGHFSLHQYKKQGFDQIRMKTTSIPDILEPNPPPTLCRAMKDLGLGKTLNFNTDVKNSQMRSVPTNYNLKVREGEKLVQEDAPDDLRIAVNYTVCCMCALPVKKDSAVSLVNDSFDGVSDFGRILSVLSSLTETPVLSHYACKTCEDIVMSCFHRLVEINAKLVVARRRLDEFLCVGDLPPTLPCHACSAVLENHDEYKDHLIVHLLDRKDRPVVYRIDDECENVPEADLAAVRVADALHLDHPYVKSEIPDDATEANFGDSDNEITICDTCGVEVEQEKLVGHLQVHKRREMMTMMMECPICQKEVTRGSLSHHLKRHDENMFSLKTPRKNSYTAKTCFYSCQVCGEKLKTLDERDAHKEEKHGIKKKNTPHCYHCDFKARTTKILKVHMRKNHPDKLVARCEDCDIDFYHENAVLVHNAVKHKDIHKLYMEKKKNLMKTVQAMDGEQRRERLKARLLDPVLKIEDPSGPLEEDRGMIFHNDLSGTINAQQFATRVESDSEEPSQAIMYIDDNGYYTTAPGSSEPIVMQIEDIRTGTWNLPDLDSAATEEIVKHELLKTEPIMYEEEGEPEQYYEWVDGEEEMQVEALDADGDADEEETLIQPITATEFFVMEGNTVTKYLQYT